MTIQRWDFDENNDYPMSESPLGDFVLNADHEREVAEFRKLLAEWRVKFGDYLSADDLCKRTDEVLGVKP